VTERLRVREIDDDEGQRLVRIIRRGSGRKPWTRFLEFCRYLRSLYPPATRIAIICDNFSPHLTTAKDARVGTWAATSNVEIACTPANSSWFNRIEAQFTALRYVTLNGTDHAAHQEQASMIRRYIIWRNNHAYDERLRRIVDRANVAWCGTNLVVAWSAPVVKTWTTSWSPRPRWSAA
jgi:DDE superfamily endonuclease